MINEFNTFLLNRKPPVRPIATNRPGRPSDLTVDAVAQVRTAARTQIITYSTSQVQVIPSTLTHIITYAQQRVQVRVTAS